MANIIKYGPSLSLLRSIQKELRLSLKHCKTKDKAATTTTNDASVQHMLELMRENQLTERRFCRPKDHYTYFAQTYLTLLRSLRMEDELVGKYFNKAERSIKDSARLVGLELPKLDNIHLNQPK